MMRPTFELSTTTVWLQARPTPCGLRILSFGNERGGNAIGDDGLVALVAGVVLALLIAASA